MYRWLVDKFKNLEYKADKSLQNVISPWPRTDDSKIVDVNAFRYPILNPVENDKDGNDKLLNWESSPGVIRY